MAGAEFAGSSGGGGGGATTTTAATAAAAAVDAAGAGSGGDEAIAPSAAQSVRQRGQRPLRLGQQGQASLTSANAWCRQRSSGKRPAPASMIAHLIG